VNVESRAGTVTRLLRNLQPGERADADRLFECVYDELRELAAAYLRKEAHAKTLQPTALVNEAYLKLVEVEDDWESRAHFMGIAARAMRQVLVDAARARGAQKRGGKAARVALVEDMLAGTHVSLSEALCLDEALTALADKYERPARVAELRFFGELTMPQVAEALGIARSTADSDWAFARAWLARALSEETTSG
jgi:RNA polymerase sigma-70 factor (ECF subfamily)